MSRFFLPPDDGESCGFTGQAAVNDRAIRRGATTLAGVRVLSRCSGLRQTIWQQSQDQRIAWPVGTASGLGGLNKGIGTAPSRLPRRLYNERALA